MLTQTGIPIHYSGAGAAGLAGRLVFVIHCKFCKAVQVCCDRRPMHDTAVDASERYEHDGVLL